MVFWICDTHRAAGKLTKRDNWRDLFGENMRNCEIRIVSDDNALALGWIGL